MESAKEAQRGCHADGGASVDPSDRRPALAPAALRGLERIDVEAQRILDDMRAHLAACTWSGDGPHDCPEWLELLELDAGNERRWRIWMVRRGYLEEDRLA